MAEDKPQGKILFDSICKKWKGLVGSLHKGDRELLLKMILEICDYNESSFDTIANNKESESHMMNLFFLLVIIQQQGLLNKINKNLDIKNKASTSLLDFMPR